MARKNESPKELKPRTHTPWFRRVVPTLFCCVGIFVVFSILGLPVPVITFDLYREPKVAFKGDSSNLRATQIVPTLDTPIEEGKNAIWCASFQLAWNTMEEEVLNSPAILDRATPEWSRLNAFGDAAILLPPQTTYVKAGIFSDDFRSDLEREMHEAYPDAEMSSLDSFEPGSLFSFAHLSTKTIFPIPYFENNEPLAFKGMDGTTSDVVSFGLFRKHKDAYLSRRKQVQVLFHEIDENNSKTRARPEHFALELCAVPESDEIVVACVTKGVTLAATLQNLDRCLEEALVSFPDELGTSHQFAVPNIVFQIEHHFRELLGARIVEPEAYAGLPLGPAVQTIEFTLDRSGAKLSSSVFMSYLSAILHYEVDHPFLFYMKRRDADRPYFVMWIENSELLEKWEE
jgi:hypothetical protein